MGVLTAAELEEELSIGYDRGGNERRLTELVWARRILSGRFMRLGTLHRRSSSVADGSAA
jgi:hypothetical protein